MNSGGIRRQHRAENRSLSLKADHDATRFHSVAFGQNIQIQTTSKALQNFFHVSKHETILLHIRAAHVLWQSSGCRLMRHKLVGRLRAISNRQNFVFKQISGLAYFGDQVLTGKLLEDLASFACFTHVTRQQTTVGRADFCDRLAGVEVNNFGCLKRFVWFTPSDYWNL